jgi:tetratricopeptide (TPR) repeat protein
MSSFLDDEEFTSVMERLQSAKRWDLILRFARERLAVDADDADAHGWSGIAAVRSGNLAAAEWHAAELQARNPDEPWTYQLLAELCFKQGRFSEAHGHLERALANWPTNPNFHQMLIGVQIARGNEPAAAAAACETLQLNPTNLPARFAALVLKYRFAYRADMVEEFLAALQSLLSDDPQHAAILTTIGEAHIFRFGSPASALPYFEQALAGDPQYTSSSNSTTLPAGSPAHPPLRKSHPSRRP